MSKDFRFDRDRDQLDRKRQKASHRQQRQARDHWNQRSVADTADDNFQQLITTTDLRRLGTRSI